VASAPEIPTLSEVVRRAAAVCDPNDENDAVAQFVARLEDEDQPVTAIADLETFVYEHANSVDPDDGALMMTAAVAVYLAHRPDELEDDPEDILRLALRAEFDGKPPPEVALWLSQRTSP
jgi:hypothetical protein